MIFYCHFCFYVHFIYIDLKLGLFISERLSIDLLLFATFQVITLVAVGGSRPCLPPACSCPPWVPGTWWGVVDKQHHHSPWTQGKVWKLTPCVRTMLAWGPHLEWCCKAWFYITIFNLQDHNIQECQTRACQMVLLVQVIPTRVPPQTTVPHSHICQKA